MDSGKQEIVEKLRSSNNILVTVSSNPSVDQLSACIGLTLLLNKLEKHATAVFSGHVPSTLEFLKPEETLEKNTDSLRDFIIALDKTKADKLRYKVEDKVVKIFITPYRTSLSSNDLDFSQGDFNIDVVLALGVHQQSDLDQAITSHGRILHDATVACINTTQSGELGTVNWSKPDASSLSELVVELAKSFDEPLLDQQISTALLTGIVAETDRFRNEKTTAATMSLSADLMTAGANQQLVAKELEHEVDVRNGTDNQSGASVTKPADISTEPDETPKPDDGTLEIDHLKSTEQAPVLEELSAEPEKEDQPTLPPPMPQDHQQSAAESASPETPPQTTQDPSRSLITEAPTLGGRLTANTSPEEEHLDPSIDPLGGTMGNQSILNRDQTTGSKAPSMQPLSSSQSSPTPAPQPPEPSAVDVPEPLSMPEPPKPQQAPPTPSMPLATSVPQPPQFNAPTQTPQPAAPTSPAPQPQPAQPAPAPQPVEPPKPPSLTEREDPAEKQQIDIDEVEKARQEVLKAISEQSSSNALPPVQALNAQPVELGRHDDQPSVPGGGQLSPPNAPAPHMPEPLPPNAPDLAPFKNSPADQPLTMPMPPGVNIPPPQTTPPTNAPSSTPNSPPPVPPPMMPSNFSK